MFVNVLSKLPERSAEVDKQVVESGSDQVVYTASSQTYD